jgi:glycosyltransferase involved in cell wall biosynthesis
MTADAMGGVWTYVYELAKGLKSKKYEIILAVMGDAPLKAQFDQMLATGNVKICFKPFRLEWMENPWGDVDNAGEWLLSLSDMYQPDLVHVNGYAHVSLPWNVPVVCVAHSCVYSWFSHVRMKLPDSHWEEYKKRVVNGLKTAATVVAPSMAMLKDLETHYGNLKNARVIYNGRSGYDICDVKKEPIIFASGRIWDDAKNLKLLMTISKHFHWPLYIAGSGNPDSEYDGHLGLLSESEMASWYSRASIYISSALYEPFGLSVLEAAFCNCALILSDISSLREIWADAALYVNPRRTEEIIVAVERLINSNQMISEYARKAYRKSLKYTPDFMCNDYVQIYNELLMSL